MKRIRVRSAIELEIKKKDSGKNQVQNNMSDSGHRVGKPPNYDKKGLRSFEMWSMKMKAWLEHVYCGAVLVSRVDGTLSPSEATTLALTVAGEKLQSEARYRNTKGNNGLILTFETPAIMNKIIQNQKKIP